MEEDSFYYSNNMDTDLDFSFTSMNSDRTFGSSSARSSLARSSLTLSFNERLSLSSSATTPHHIHHTHTHHHIHHLRPHRRSDPHWSAIKAATNLSPDGRLHLRHLKLIKLLGSGNLGRVFLCRIRDYPNPNAQFALKVVDKDLLSPKKLAHVEMEAQILSRLDHPFLPTLYAHIEVSHYTCLLIDYCSGGDLHSLLRKQPSNRLPVHAVRFYAAEVLVALEYLHSLGVVYRDLKPENILIREDGHIMLSDFDLCFTADVSPKVETVFDHADLDDRGKHYHTGCSSCFGGGERRRLSRTRSARERRVRMEYVAEPTSAFSKSCVGTHEYLAPELVSGAGHGNGVDWWAFGVLIYELLYGTTPFKGANKEGTLRNIASARDVVFSHMATCEKDEVLARDLIEKLLVKDPAGRMGAARGAAEIKRHPFFAGVKWALIRGYRPPEVRGGVVRRTRSHLSNSSGMHVRRRWWWKGLSCFLKKKVFSSSTSFSSSSAASTTSSKVLLHNSSFKSVVSVNSDIFTGRRYA